MTLPLLQVKVIDQHLMSAQIKAVSSSNIETLSSGCVLRHWSIFEFGRKHKAWKRVLQSVSYSIKNIHVTWIEDEVPSPEKNVTPLPKSVHLPISKLHSILAVANLLAQNNLSQIWYCCQISLQSAAVNCNFSGKTIWHLLGNIYFAGDGTYIKK